MQFFTQMSKFIKHPIGMRTMMEMVVLLSVSCFVFYLVKSHGIFPASLLEPVG